MAVPARVIDKAAARARSEPRFARVLAAITDAPTAAAGEYTRHAARALNAERRASAVEELRSGALPTSAVQQALGLKTPQAVHRLRSRGRVLGLPVGNVTWFPAWQLADGRLRPDLPRLLEALGRFTDDVVAADRVMRLRRDELGGRSIAEALDRRATREAAWAVLDHLGA